MTESHQTSGEKPPCMRLYKILDSSAHAPCKIAIFTDGHTIKVLKKVCFRNAAFDTPSPPAMEAALFNGVL